MSKSLRRQPDDLEEEDLEAARRQDRERREKRKKRSRIEAEEE